MGGPLSVRQLHIQCSLLAMLCLGVQRAHSGSAGYLDVPSSARGTSDNPCIGAAMNAQGVCSAYGAALKNEGPQLIGTLLSCFVEAVQQSSYVMSPVHAAEQLRLQVITQAVHVGFPRLAWTLRKMILKSTNFPTKRRTVTLCFIQTSL